MRTVVYVADNGEVRVLYTLDMYEGGGGQERAFGNRDAAALGR